MRRIAGQVAVAGFLVLAIVGTASGLPPFVCSIRALSGAAVLYVLTRVAGHVAVTILADTLAGQAARRGKPKDVSSDTAD